MPDEKDEVPVGQNKSIGSRIKQLAQDIYRVEQAEDTEGFGDAHSAKAEGKYAMTADDLKKMKEAPMILNAASKEQLSEGDYVVKLWSRIFSAVFDDSEEDIFCNWGNTVPVSSSAEKRSQDGNDCAIGDKVDLRGKQNKGGKTDDDEGGKTDDDEGGKTDDDEGGKTDDDEGGKTDDDEYGKIDDDEYGKIDDDEGSKTDDDENGDADDNEDSKTDDDECGNADDDKGGKTDD
ncbi:hypothetical protein INT47_004233, partial [Mucor saturninus]